MENFFMWPIRLCSATGSPGPTFTSAATIHYLAPIWRSEIFGCRPYDLRPQDRLLVDCEHDQTPIVGLMDSKIWRIRSQQYFLEMAGHDSVVVSVAQHYPASGERPVLHRCIGTHDLV